MQLHSSLQYMPAVPLESMQVLVPNTPQYFLQTAYFSYKLLISLPNILSSLYFPASCGVNKDQFLPTVILLLLFHDRKFLTE
jgi:hypothetical protein